MVTLPKNKIIQLVLVGHTPVKDPWSNSSTKIHHPIHLHGHSFYVLKQGFGIYDNQTNLLTDLNEDIVCENKPCSRLHWKTDMTQKLNFDNPPIKDTVIVPDSGYVVIRFRSDNPGFWLMHCHTMFHLTEGMMLVFNESSPDIPQPPASFPQCNSFDMDDKSFSDWVKGEKTSQGETVSKFDSTTKQTLLHVIITLSVVLCIAMVIIVYLLFDWKNGRKVGHHELTKVQNTGTTTKEASAETFLS